MKIAVLVSGGVDSSLALRLLHDQGHDVTAFYLKIWLEDELAHLGHCPWQDDLEYVQALCSQLNVPLEIVSLQQEYWEQVVAYVLNEIKVGRTPNPDVLCNQRVKFGAFYKKIGPEFEKVATGHYAQVEQGAEGLFQLKMTPDPIKDQTYFLAHLDQHQLARALFPIGHLTKKEVRELAQKFDIPSKDRKDSQGVCFLGKIKFSDFIRHHVGARPGDMIEQETGKFLGQHAGFWFYTIGQRKGLGLSGGPWYVVAKDPLKNIVYISSNYFSDEKARNAFDVSPCHWISGRPPKDVHLQVKIRHGEKIYQCNITPLSVDRLHIKLPERDQGIAPGQFAVFYDGQICLGCGVIE